jgi:hypothetical protein
LHFPHLAIQAIRMVVGVTLASMEQKVIVIGCI